MCQEELKKLFIAAIEGFTLVAHYAVYEKRWLDWFTGLNLEFVCTRELVRNEISNLPSGTLRAVAGILGHSMKENRRAVDHVTWTEFVFQALQTGSYQIHSFSSVERLSIPACPGVYRFLDSTGSLLYIGKAGNLRSRVNSHFTGKQKGRHAELISRTSRVVHQETETALHAAILEIKLISELSPLYNLVGKI